MYLSSFHSFIRISWKVATSDEAFCFLAARVPAHYCWCSLFSYNYVACTQYTFIFPFLPSPSSHLSPGSQHLKTVKITSTWTCVSHYMVGFPTKNIDWTILRGECTWKLTKKSKECSGQKLVRWEPREASKALNLSFTFSVFAEMNEVKLFLKIHSGSI